MLRRAAPVVALTIMAVGALTHANARPPAVRPSPTAAGALRGAPRLQLIADFPDQQITGVAVSPEGRIFVNLPRWTVDVPVSVGEVINGRIVPFPNREWNAWSNLRPLSPNDHFVCVQSVVIDGKGNLWVLDPASPGQMGPVPNGPKLVKIDLRTNQVAAVIAFDQAIAIPGSYLNDIRFSPDGRWGYLSDSGVRGSLVVVDLQSGRARRVLDGHPSTQIERGVVPRVDGRELRRPDNREPQFAADGIALSPDGATFYWQALTGRTLYSLPTAVLQDPVRAANAGAFVRAVGTTHVADGLWLDRAGRFFVTDPERDSVEMAAGPGAPLTTLVRDPRLRWPDSFAQGPDGAIYVSTSHIQDSPWFKPQVRFTPSQIWRINPR